MLISLKNATKVYKDGENEIYGLNNISINIDENEFICIVGASGCGKSTLLNIIGMIDELSSGEYYLNNVSTKVMKNKAKAQFRNNEFGFIFQHFGLIKYISVYNNIKLPLEYGKFNKHEINSKVNLMLKELELYDKKNELPNRLSGGQCQKVAIARAVINNPKIILADEPTGALDKKNTKEIMNLLKRMNENGKTIILVTHDLELVRYCSRLIKMSDGKIISDKKIKFDEKGEINEEIYI